MEGGRHIPLLFRGRAGSRAHSIPTLSQNMTVIWRRSACAVAMGFGAAGAPIIRLPRRRLRPNGLQARATLGAIAIVGEQSHGRRTDRRAGSDAPHLTQNFEPSRTSALEPRG